MHQAMRWGGIAAATVALAVVVGVNAGMLPSLHSGAAEAAETRASPVEQVATAPLATLPDDVHDPWAAPGAAVTPAGMFVRFEGIPGESADRDHRQWSDLLSFQQGVMRETAGAAGTGRALSSPTFEDVLLTKELDTASPKLQQAVATGEVIPTVEVDVIAAYTDGGRQSYYHYELRNVLITGYSVASAGDVPMDSLSLSFGGITVTYTEFDSAGRVKGRVEFEWSVEEGR